MELPEGATPLDRDELVGLKFPHIETRGELDQMEQVNIQDGLRWLGSRRSVDVLSEAFARRLHEKLFGDVWDWAGTYRRTEKNIGVAPAQIGMDLRALLDDAKFWIDHGTYPPKEIALRFHHRLVKIHLYPNGNGRHARIMADALLEKVMDEPPIHWGDTGMQKANEQRRRYIDCLRAADRNDYEPLLREFGDG